MARFLPENDENVSVAVDTAFPDESLMVFLNKEYTSSKADVIACGIANTDNYVDGKWYFYVTVGRYHDGSSCYFLLRQFRDKSVYVENHSCLNEGDFVDGSNSSSTFNQEGLGKYVFYRPNKIDTAFNDLTKYYQTEREFVAHFGSK
jgi:hypothetical protein